MGLYLYFNCLVFISSQIEIEPDWYMYLQKKLKTISWIFIGVFLPSVRYQSNHVSTQDPATNYDPTHNVLAENGFGVMGPSSGTVQSQNLERVIRLTDK